MEGRRGSGNRGFMVALESAPADHEDKTHFVIHDSIGYLLAVNARMLQRVMTARLAATGVMCTPTGRSCWRSGLVME